MALPIPNVLLGIDCAVTFEKLGLAIGSVGREYIYATICLQQTISAINYYAISLKNRKFNLNFVSGI